jgi:hypothetical protein
MDPVQKAQVVFWRDTIVAVCAILVLWVAIKSAQHQGVDVGVIILTIVFLVVAGILISIIYRNLRDATRAESLRSQIITIKEEHATQVKARESELLRHKQQSRQAVENLQEKVSQAASRKAGYVTAGSLQVLARLADLMACGLSDLLGSAQALLGFIPDEVRFPLLNLIVKTQEEEWKWFHRCVWKVGRDFNTYEAALLIFAASLEPGVIESLPRNIEIDKLIEALHQQENTLTDYAASLLAE